MVQRSAIIVLLLSLSVFAAGGKQGGAVRAAEQKAALVEEGAAKTLAESREMKAEAEKMRAEAEGCRFNRLDAVRSGPRIVT